jgi:hypothetical protein
MNYLKLYEDWKMSDEYIRLDSIGYLLDPNKGVAYQLNDDGSYDMDEPYDLDNADYFNYILDDLSDEERELVDKYSLSCKEFVKSRINFDLIESAKDISLDYLDRNWTLSAQVFSNFFDEYDRKLLIYNNIFNHRMNMREYSYFFKNNMDKIKKSNNISYRFWYIPDTSYSQKTPEEQKEIDLANEDLLSILSEMCPNEKIETR